VNPYVISGLVVTLLATVAIGAYGLRFARTTSDFLVASRAVSPAWNAAAISGEYLSAASFLGVAGLVMRYGVDMLWYPVGFAAGYLALLLFVAAPLRRSGAFTLPDFCEVRLRSPVLRRLATIFVIFIGCLYLVPQLQGAGLTFTTVTGGSYVWGALLVGLVVTANVALGGMRAITFVQAFQYWLKLTALAVPMIFLILQWQSDGRPAVTPPAGAVFPAATTVVIEQDATLTVGGQTRVVRAGDELTFAAGDPVPRVSTVDLRTGAEWLLPGGAKSLFATYSLILATFLGTMGLPHVLVRFYTNPDGASARRTTLVVLGLVGLFYLLPTLYGVLGRIYTPQLLMTGRTDAVVLLLPEAALGTGYLGRLLGALVTAGALAAFLSTSSGLLTSVAGVVFTDVLRAERSGGSARDFRLATALSAVVPIMLSISVANMDVSRVVGLAFAVAASSFCPLLVLGIWWRGLTDIGAAAGVLAGGGAAMAAVLVTVLGPPLSGWPAEMIGQPAAWTVPLAFAVMVIGSLLTHHRLPRDVNATMLRLHAPESLRL